MSGHREVIFALKVSRLVKSLRGTPWSSLLQDHVTPAICRLPWRTDVTLRLSGTLGLYTFCGRGTTGVTDDEGPKRVRYGDVTKMVVNKR